MDPVASTPNDILMENEGVSPGSLSTESPFTMPLTTLPAEALEMGWINKVVPHDKLMSVVQIWCDELLDKAPSYIELTKVASNVWWDSLIPTMEHGKLALLGLAGGDEMTEGATAFMEKRKPNFRQFRK
jgi:1,4-dihydroxy-2-naphthoyl-CoA synthase